MTGYNLCSSQVGWGQAWGRCSAASHFCSTEAMVRQGSLGPTGSGSRPGSAPSAGVLGQCRVASLGVSIILHWHEAALAVPRGQSPGPVGTVCGQPGTACFPDCLCLTKAAGVG